ncbi:hypothetical protein HD806DRAFT_508796 [Xylariaceae sp. AK1471]|nr:hypothetical protein HD806DRAFT_508796 [Xylariaceae sp. AK1471]
MVSSLFHFVKDCLGTCFPSKHSRPASPTHRVDHYNAQLRANLGLAERRLELPACIASDPTASRPQSRSNESHYTTGTTMTAAPSQLQSQSPPRIKSQGGRFPTTASADSDMQWAKDPMNREELTELFDLLHETLEHVPYAICGLGALIDHGFTRRRANKISLLCPQECKNNVKAWAAARGYEIFVDSVGLPMRDGSIRRVRIKYIDAGFERLQRVRSSFSAAYVLSMASQLDNVAAGYLENRRRGDERALKTIANDVFWCLDRIAARRERVDPGFLHTFLGEDFFADFTARYTEARPEMARAGIDVSSVLAKHREASSLREHNEMLQRYGLQGDVVAQQPGQFESMRDLTNSKSVYTLRDRDSRTESVVLPPLPMPQPPEASHLRHSNHLPESKLKSTSKLTRKWNSVREAPSSQSQPSQSGLGRSLTSASTRRHPRQYQAKTSERPVAEWI